MATATKRAMVRTLRAMGTATKRVRARVARGMGTVTRVAGDKEGNGEINK
jgi:hypothetical protein